MKDRCFYSDLSTYNVVSNKWKVIETFGSRVTNRKSHSSCMYQKYYIIYGGINDCEEVLGEINWIALDGKKLRWKTAQAVPRFNHKIVPISN